MGFNIQLGLGVEPLYGLFGIRTNHRFKPNSCDGSFPTRENRSLGRAVDQRFAMIISNNSGCGGADFKSEKIWRDYQKDQYFLSHWFCENFKKYNDNEDESPVDQHMLLALSAPRPVYIASAQGDLWADPKGEFLSALAEPVYKLFGFDFGAIEQPEENQPVYGRIGYHLRSGKHDVTLYDWEQYLNFADQYLK